MVICPISEVTRCAEVFRSSKKSELTMRYNLPNLLLYAGSYSVMCVCASAILGTGFIFTFFDLCVLSPLLDFRKRF